MIVPGLVFPDLISSGDKSSSIICKVNFAVLPNNFFNLSGSVIPGSSNNILFIPCLCIVGSFVPYSSTLLLTTSIDCDTAVSYTHLTLPTNREV